METPIEADIQYLIERIETNRDNVGDCNEFSQTILYLRSVLTCLASAREKGLDINKL